LIKRLLILTAISALLVIGCGDDDNPVNSDKETEAKYYYRSPGYGTISIEIYTTSSDDRFFRQFRSELKQVTFGSGDTVGNTSEIIPLAIGNSWIYTTTVFDSLGNELGSSTDTSVVSRDTTIDQETWHILNYRGKPSNLGINRSGGYWSRTVTLSPGTDRIASLGEPYLSSKFPATVGQVFDNESGYSTLVLDSDTVLTVAAGSFKCYKYKKTPR
jgi:hypothetical protein